MQIDLEDVGFCVVIDTYRKILDLLDHRERRNFFFLLAMFVVAGLIEVVGVASIFPFLAVLSNPAAVQVDAYLGVAYDALGFTSTNSFLLFLGIVVLVILFLRIASEALTQSWITTRDDRSATLGLLESAVIRIRRPPAVDSLISASGLLGSSSTVY